MSEGLWLGSFRLIEVESTELRAATESGSDTPEAHRSSSSLEKLYLVIPWHSTHPAA
jgi:hypothetical protein